jgi:hypothetical protein
MRLPSAKLMALVKTCATEFRQKYLHTDPGYETFWVTGLDVPPSFPGLEQGKLSFTREEIEGCFGPVVARVEDMLREMLAARDGGEDVRVSVRHFHSSLAVLVAANGRQNIFLAGTFACSDWVSKKVREAVRYTGSPTVWVGHDCTPYGAVLQARQLDYVNLQTS